MSVDIKQKQITVLKTVVSGNHTISQISNQIAYKLPQIDQVHLKTSYVFGSPLTSEKSFPESA